MNNTLKVALISVLSALVVVSVVTYLRPANVVVKEIRELVKEQLGATPGNEVNHERFIVNGVEHIYKRQHFNTNGTTTVCTVPWPVSAKGASTTLVHASIHAATIGTSTTNPQFAIYKGRGQTSTTTVIAGAAVTATGTLVYATSTTYNSLTVPVGGFADEYIIGDVRQGSVPFLPVNGRSGTCIFEWIGSDL